MPTFKVGDRVNVLAPFDDAMPNVEGGYEIVSVVNYTDGLTGEHGQTCSLAVGGDEAPRDFADRWLEAI